METHLRPDDADSEDAASPRGTATAAELAAMERLQRISIELIREEDVQSLYEQIVDAAVELLHADMGSMQLLDHEQGALRLLAWKGFAAESADFWTWVRPASGTTCGAALEEGARVVVADVEAYEPFRGTDDAEAFRWSGIRAVQSTPLHSRSGGMLGMLSTHWRRPHRPSEADLRLVDVLARQAADLIERMQAEEKLREAHRRQNEFLAMLSHELRNPLAPIATAVELLKAESESSPVQRAATEALQRQVTQLTRLVDDLLQVTRVTTGKIELRRERLLLEDVVSAAVESVALDIARQGQRLVVSLPQQPLWLDGDRERLTQVLLNLLGNASKYTEREGQIELAAEQREGQVFIRLRDNGIGISAQLLPKIFDLFVQGERELARSGGGLGVGLALARRLVEMHDGTIEARSNGAGLGSEFLVRLPAASAPQPSARHASVPADSRRSLRLLIVDDNEDMAHVLARLLEKLGHTVHTANDGVEALRVALDVIPDVVFLDLGLPEMDGYEVAQRLRREPSLRNVVLVALTGYGMESDRLRSREAGFDEHVVKPVNVETLRSILAAIGESRAA